MLKLEKIIAAVLLLVASKTAYTQNPYYIGIDVTKGLLSNTIYDAYQDTKGFMWLSHTEGLSRYDGFECITYSSADQTSKAGGCIREDNFGRVWYENFDGYIYYVENDSLKHLATQRTPSGYVNFGILGNTLITTHANTLDFFDLKTLNLIKSIPLSDGYISNAIQNNGKYYLSASYIYTITEKGIEDSTAHTKIEPKNTFLANLCSSRNGFLMYTRENYNNPVIENINGVCAKKFNIPGKGFIRMIEYTGDYYWVCTPVGVYGFTENGVALNNGKPYFSDKNILGVEKDHEGNYWFLTGADGVFMVPELNIRLWNFGGNTPKDVNIYGNTAWVSTQSGEILKANLESFSYTNIYQNNSGHDIINICVDSVRKNIFFTSTVFKQIDFEGNLISQAIPSVKDVKKIDNKYYAFTSSGAFGLFTIKNSSGPSPWDSMHNYYKDTKSWVGSSIFVDGIRGKSLAYDSLKKTIYTATNLGLFAATPLGFTEILQHGKHIFLLQLEEYGNTIFALGADGIVYTISSNNQLVPYLTKLPHSVTINKIKISRNHLFLFSNIDLYHLNLDASSLVPQRVDNIINANEINDVGFWQNKLVFAVSKGLVMVDFPVEKYINGSTIYINKFTINGKTFNANEVVKVSYNQKDIEINYSILSFSPREKLPLSYSINGGAWLPLPFSNRTLQLASLSPGNYTVAFKLGDNPPSKTIQFIINKPLWLQWWFWSIVAIVVLLGGFFYYRWRLNQQKKQNQLVVEKIELEKNLRHSMLASIKSQMNPHFFYNALNTIQSYIFSDDKRNASSYLAKFSKLTRTILEMSERETVTLTEEVNALILYLELEKARFNDDDFHFSIEVDSSIDMDMVSIPSMIVQPYVENAIKHGLLHKKGKKHLKVDFYKERDNLHIVVDDNGIGRKKSAELGKIKKDKHTSFATLANLKRIEILNKGNNKIGVDYTDKADFSGNIMGTTVSIIIPIKGIIYDEHLYQSYNN
jgi:two-component sensor histidine kinase